jgi:hypothetical protein
LGAIEASPRRIHTAFLVRATHAAGHFFQVGNCYRHTCNTYKMRQPNMTTERHNYITEKCPSTSKTSTTSPVPFRRGG